MAAVGEDGLAPLVEAAELARLLADEAPPTVLDVSWRLGAPGWGASEHASGHIPGAHFVDLDTELAGPPGAGGRHPLPDAATLEAALRRGGVRQAVPVVVYDQGADGMAAARAWWVLRRAGHPAVRVLDGGLRAWREQGLAVTTGETPAGTAGDVTVDRQLSTSPAAAAAQLAGAPRLLVAESASRLAADGLLLDARAAERYRGEVEPIDEVAGHIPGAVSAPVAELVDGTGRLLPPEALRHHFERLGVAQAPAVGAYCGSGVSAALLVLALRVAGFDAALYAGSWSEWIADPSRPIATGPTPR